MKKIKILLIATSYLLLTCNVFAQEKCNISELSKSQQKELKLFWNDLKYAINRKDKIALQKLFNFPYNCSFCVTAKNDKPYIIVNAKSFIKENYKIFFSEYFLDIVNNHEILKILNGDIVENGKCEYSFSFPIIKPSKKSEGIQGFLTVKQLGKKYKIFSAWAVP
jgi:hypothetical protein